MKATLLGIGTIFSSAIYVSTVVIFLVVLSWAGRVARAVASMAALLLHTIDSNNSSGAEGEATGSAFCLPCVKPLC